MSLKSLTINGALCLFVYASLFSQGGDSPNAGTLPSGTLVYLPQIQHIVPTATPTPLSQGLMVKSDRIFTRSTSQFTFIVGEVVNNTSAPAYLINLHAKFFDDTHKQIGSGDNLLSLGMLLPGHVSPFKLRFPKDIGIVTSYEASFFYQPQVTTDFRELTIVSQHASNKSGVEIFGETRNDTEINIQYPVIVVTFYDATGTVIDTARNETDATVVIATGQKYPYTINTGYSFSYVNYVVQAQGYLKK